MCHVRVLALPVCHVVTHVVDHVAGLKVAFRGRHDLDLRRARGRDNGVSEQHRTSHRVRYLEMTKMVGRVEAIERPVTQLVEREVMALLRLLDGTQHEYAG